MKEEERPILNIAISADDFRAFYWLKKELTDFCKKQGLSRQGGKLEIANRIVHFLETGEKLKPQQTKKSRSSFDWKTANLTLETIITDNYKNTENVRAFFQKHSSKTFKFNVLFMNWMKENTGKTLADALQKWEELIDAKKQHKGAKTIAPQFEYNRYIRDFLADNQDKSKADAIQFWNKKKARRGDNLYEKSDIEE